MACNPPIKAGLLLACLFLACCGSIADRREVEVTFSYSEPNFRDFVMQNYNHLARDLANGHGMYLAALCRLVKRSCDDTEFISLLIEKLKSSGTATEFASVVEDMPSR